MSGPVRLYDATYERFQLDARQRVRLDTYGHDLGQNSWLTIDEWRTALGWLGLAPGSRVLDVACGSGGPARWLARETGAAVVGVDRNRHAVRAAAEAARREGLDALVRFQEADAGQPLPFDDACFDAVVCVDSINHLPDRAAVLRDWHRLLVPGGWALFTDPIVVSGLLSSQEIAVRASIGYFVFALRDEDERLVREAGFDLVRCQDTTANVALVARRWRDARASFGAELLEDEGEETFTGMQRFLATVAALAEQRRLSRYTFLARKEATPC
jgi:SAM-dependent methyltransferase